MVYLNSNTKKKPRLNRKPRNCKGNSDQFKNLMSMCKMSVEVINQLYNPIDAINRFINLALQGLEESSQSRQFLLESKLGIRKTSQLLKRLNIYSKKIEREIRKVSVNK